MYPFVYAYAYKVRWILGFNGIIKDKFILAEDYNKNTCSTLCSYLYIWIIFLLIDHFLTVDLST